MSLWILAPIAVALLIVWHEWRQRNAKIKPPMPKVTDHGYEGGAADAYCSKCGRAYFAHEF